MTRNRRKRNVARNRAAMLKTEGLFRPFIQKKRVVRNLP